MKHRDSFEDAVIAAVNHSGDSDSTGAICGNLIGAILGYGCIPSHFIEKLELKELIVELADDLGHGCTICENHLPVTEDEKRWEEKYLKVEVPQHTYSQESSRYQMMPEALRQQHINQLMQKIKSSEDEREECRIGYKLALGVYDTDTFQPLQPLPYHRLCDEPEEFRSLKEYLPAYYYGYYDERYSPHNNNRVFKVNFRCFDEERPIIAVRADCYVMNECRAGLIAYDNTAITGKYPGWAFYKLDPSSADGNHAVFTNQLEKEFAVELAHLWEDGTLHRIYHLYY